MHQYVYLLSAKDSDYYAEVTAISMQTLRMTNPNAHVIILTDSSTYNLNSPGMRLIRALADKVLSIQVPFDDAVLGSRYLKTNMRNLVDGDFVYLDGDTLILSSLDKLWNTRAEFAAVLDEPNSGEAFQQVRVSIFKQLNWNLNTEKYINSGVILMRDTPAMREFSSQLFDLWQHQIAQVGKHNDQFALNHLLSITTIKQKVLWRGYNAQFWMDPLAARKAKILHVFTGNFEDRNDTVLHVLAKKFKREGVLDIEAIKTLIASGNPWLALDTVRKCLAMGCYLKAAKLYATRFAKRINLAGFAIKLWLLTPFYCSFFSR